MSFRSMLVPVADYPELEGIIKYAVGFARSHDAHLNAVYVRPDPLAAVPLIGDGLTADIVGDLCDAAERQGKAMALDFRERVGSWVEPFGFAVADAPEGPARHRIRWHELVGRPGESIGRFARIADLTFVPKPDSPSDIADELLTEVLYRSGRPMMMVPKNVKGEQGRHIAVAWDGRTEIARTVAAAIPALEQAERVTILTVGPEPSERPTSKHLQDYLGMHGVTASLKTLEAGKRDTGATLLGGAADVSADMLLMGGYSHSRWREMVMGGVTRTVLNSATLPVLMCH